MKPGEYTSALLVQLREIGIETNHESVKSVLDFLTKKVNQQEMLEHFNELTSALDSLRRPHIPEDHHKVMKQKALKAWDDIVVIYNTSLCEEVPTTHQEEPSFHTDHSAVPHDEPAHFHHEPSRSHHAKPKKFPWVWVVVCTICTVFAFMMGRSVFPDMGAASSFATAELKKKIADQANEFALERNAWNAACLAEQIKISEKTAITSAEELKNRLGSKQKQPETTTTP